MAERIEVTPKQAVRLVLQRWDDLPAEQIGEIARDVWHASVDDDSDTGEADLLASLQLCKGIPDAADVGSLIRLWQAVTDGIDGSPFGGFIHAEESRNFAAARRFAESLLLARVEPLLADAFNALALSAGKLATPVDRADGYVTAADTLAEYVDALTLSDASAGKLDKWLKRHDALLRQLIDAEGIDE
jgi:hypothetical protein